MSAKSKKDKVQVKIELEGPIKDFLESECALECRSLTAHIRYIVNRYFMERNGTLSVQSVIPMNTYAPQTNSNELKVPTTNSNELLVNNTNQELQKDTNTNNIGQDSEENSPNTDVLEGEDYGYIADEVLDF